jgi:Tfp pilus assembly protein PilO
MRVGWILSALRVRWLPWAVAGAVALLTIAFGWGYLKGSTNKEKEMTRQMNAALKEQYEQMQAQHKRDTANLIRTQTKKEGVKNALKALPRPTDGCTVSDECLQHFNNGVRIFNSSTTGIDD